MTDGFVEARRAALERYLNRLAAHSAAARSEVGTRLPVLLGKAGCRAGVPGGCGKGYQH